jgi:hypothetical protein
MSRCSSSYLRLYGRVSVDGHGLVVQAEFVRSFELLNIMALVASLVIAVIAGFICEAIARDNYLGWRAGSISTVALPNGRASDAKGES